MSTSSQPSFSRLHVEEKGMYKLGGISQERMKIEVKLLLSANMKSHMPRRLAEQRMSLSDLECLKSTSSASRAISAVAELFVTYYENRARSTQ